MGNRKTKRDAAGLTRYWHGQDHELCGTHHPDGEYTGFVYDPNGNLTDKKHYPPDPNLPPTVVSLRYANGSGRDVRCSIVDGNGQALGALTLPDTGGVSSYAAIPVPTWMESVRLTVSAEDAAFNAGASARLDAIVASCGGTQASTEIEEGTLSGVTPVADALAYGGFGVDGFGDVAGDDVALERVALPSPPPPPEETQPDVTTSYAWDSLNRLTQASQIEGGVQTASASFTYPSYGWQMLSGTVNGETRSYAYGLGGELLKESVGTGSRHYVNGSLDRVLWSHTAGSESGNGAHFWLTDLNGSVFGITDVSGQMVERQRFDAFGKTEITDASGAIVNPQSAIGNRLGFQGRTNFGELGLQYFRNRFYSPDIGRFISSDPLGMVDGPNTYGFCGGDPVNRSDPMGTDYLSCDEDGAVWYQGTGTLGIARGNKLLIGRKAGNTVTLSRHLGGGSIGYDDLDTAARKRNRGDASYKVVSDVVALTQKCRVIADTADPERVWHGYHGGGNVPSGSYMGTSPDGTSMFGRVDVGSRPVSEQEALEDSIILSFSKTIPAYLQNKALEASAANPNIGMQPSGDLVGALAASYFAGGDPSPAPCKPPQPRLREFSGRFMCNDVSIEPPELSGNGPAPRTVNLEGRLRPGHTAEFVLESESGMPSVVGTAQSGTPIGMRRYRVQQATHTEPKIVTRFPPIKGETLVIVGKQEPCSYCQRQIWDAGSAGGRVEYYWSQDGKWYRFTNESKYNDFETAPDNFGFR